MAPPRTVPSLSVIYKYLLNIDLRLYKGFCVTLSVPWCLRFWKRRFQLIFLTLLIHAFLELYQLLQLILHEHKVEGKLANLHIWAVQNECLDS